jgi:ATP-binding cassette subfamily B (MDR/TAP) protein 1
MSSTCRTEYFENILEKPVPFYDLNDNASGSLVSRLATDPKQVQDLIGVNGVFPVISLCSMIGCIAIAFSFGWKLSLVATFAALPFVFLAAFMRIRYELEFDSMNAAVYSGSSQFAAEAIEAFRTVSALTMEDSILKRYSNLLQEQQKKAFRKAWLATLVFAFSDSVELCAMALTFWYGGQLLASREYEPVSFFVVYMSIILGGQQAGQFFSYGPNIAQGTAAANRMLDFRPDLCHSEKDSEKLKINTATLGLGLISNSKRLPSSMLHRRTHCSPTSMSPLEVASSLHLSAPRAAGKRPLSQCSSDFTILTKGIFSSTAKI